MKIAIDARSIERERTGVGRILINFLKQWQFQSETQFFLYFKNNVPTDEFLKNPIFTCRILPPLAGRNSNFAFEHILLPKALMTDKVDLLYAPAYSAPFICPVPFVVVIHDISYEVFPETIKGFDKIARSFMSKWSAKRSKKIIAVSYFTKSEIIKHYKIKSNKILQVYQPAVPEELLNANPTQINLPVNPYTIFIGSIFNRRNIPELIVAIEKINQRQPFDLVLVGKDRTEPPQKISELVKESNKRQGRQMIHYHQFLEDNQLLYLYKNASSVTLISDYEGFGMPMLEGMTLGVPVLIAPNSSLEEVAHGSCMITNPKNPSQIAYDLKKLENDKNLRQSLIEKGKVRAMDFSWEKSAAETLEILKNAR